MKQTSATRFESVREWNEPFLSLFSHRFDYIFAPYPNPGETPAWQTESRHPLSDRLIQQGAYLYGVRFGAEANYCLLDIDAGSTYHPKHDPFAISRIAAALESLGLVRYITCTSSYSSGLHLYFPFQQPQSSWQLAIALACLLENAGFKLQPGQLEIFPNPKPYATDSTPSLFNAHRLPLQIGSYLLNKEFEPIWSNAHTFVKQWQFAQQRNDIDSKTLKQILKQAKRKHFGISGKAEKFVNDLNAEIELGWTGYGQTNRLLGRITMREYIFHHVLSGGKPLAGTALMTTIVETAQSLPGYREWCQHQHEIEHRAEEWTRCIENSHYFHFSDQSKKPKPEIQDPELIAAIDKSPSWNQRQSAATRDRIRRAIADLLETNSLPIQATTRFQMLLKYGIGGASLYRHRDLWHPNHFGMDANQDLADAFASPVKIPPNPPTSNTDAQLDCVGDASNWHNPTSLLSDNGGNDPSGKDLNDRLGQSLLSVGGNAQVDPTSRHAQRGVGESNGRDHTIQLPLFDLQTWFDLGQAAAQSADQQVNQIRLEAMQAAPIARMQRFLESGDPILMAEAIAWAEINPGVLQVERLNLPLFEALEFDDSARDLSGVLAAISVQIQRLGWTREQVGDRLWQLLGKRSQAQLDDMELALWNLWLEELSDSKSHEPRMQR
ncbi:hypothetical protein JOY44_28390 (plasmid) [Phormidium sp. CLA17]|uniref:hypothetical protein n=1 Tax=Leptolyngbya sp. Cla-17 TaxID=2803751 RepID=UPI0018D970A1|nr:hypothetical protein [Leptolyngbya sp. Cla-17]MBM0745348.1 hypothetical protein [Leptolyngbya sp. Cla-17]